MTLDVQIFHALNSLVGKSAIIDWIIIFFASYLAYILVALFLGLIFFSRYSKSKSVSIFIVASASAIIARGVTEMIRFFYHRPRPFLAFPEANQLLTNYEWSFPSGHAAFFFAMATAIYLYDKKWGIIFLIATGLMVISRVIAGIHYPSDILGGAIIGSVLAIGIYYFYNFVQKQKSFSLKK